jgi:S1-C subfamily serine protease
MTIKQRSRPSKLRVLILLGLGLVGGGAYLILHLLHPPTSENAASKLVGQPIGQPIETPIRKPTEQPVERALSSQDLYQRVNPAIATVYTAHTLGSGMVVRSDGLVITNRHVVQDSAQVLVKTADGKTYDGQVIDLDLRHDLALIALRQADDLPIVALAQQDTLKAGDRVYALGSPEGKAGTLTTGQFTRLTEHGSLQTSPGLLRPGNSGGPLLDRQGRVIGVNKGLLEDDSGLATPAAAVRELLAQQDAL